MVLDLRSLLAFTEVADTGSFSRAAAALGAAQSALSRQVSALERELGGRLFHRTGRGVTLSEFGTLLVPRARAALASANELATAARDASASPAGVVELGFVPTVAQPLVGALCVRLRRDYPSIRLRARQGYSGEIEDWLASGQVEVGLFNRYQGAKARHAEPLQRAEMLLVATPDHPAVQAAEVSFRALAQAPLALQMRPNTLATTLHALAASRGFHLDVALEGDSPAILLDAVANAGLCMVSPRNPIAAELAAGRLRAARIVNPVIVQTTWLALGTQRPASAATRVVGRLIREIADDLVLSGIWSGAATPRRRAA